MHRFQPCQQREGEEERDDDSEEETDGEEEESEQTEDERDNDDTAFEETSPEVRDNRENPALPTVYSWRIVENACGEILTTMCIPVNYAIVSQQF